MFGTFYKFIKNEEYTRTAAVKPGRRGARPQGSKTRSGSRGQPENKQTSLRGSLDKKEDLRPPRNSSPAEEYDDEEESEYSDEEGSRLFKQVKHIFEIKVRELKNIPVLNKFICQTNMQPLAGGEAKTQKAAHASKYIQNVAVKYSFPLDEDEILESDYLQLNKDALDKQGVYNY